jgi:hypothetical protein
VHEHQRGRASRSPLAPADHNRLVIGRSPGLGVSPAVLLSLPLPLRPEAAGRSVCWNGMDPSRRRQRDCAVDHHAGSTGSRIRVSPQIVVNASADAARGSARRVSDSMHASPVAAGTHRAGRECALAVAPGSTSPSRSAPGVGAPGLAIAWTETPPRRRTRRAPGGRAGPRARRRRTSRPCGAVPCHRCASRF